MYRQCRTCLKFKHFKKFNKKRTNGKLYYRHMCKVCQSSKWFDYYHNRGGKEKVIAFRKNLRPLMKLYDDNWYRRNREYKLEKMRKAYYAKKA